MRCLVAIVGVCALVLVSAAPAIATIPPPAPLAVQFHAEPGFGGCIISVTSETTAKLGRAVQWHNDDGVDVHNIHETAGLWAHSLDPGAKIEGAATAAGTFTQQCDAGPQYPWKILISAPSHPSNPDFRVTWAVRGARAFWRYNVQYRIGNGVLRTWRPGTTDKSLVFNGTNGRTYFFRSRVINSNSLLASGFSPFRRVVT